MSGLEKRGRAAPVAKSEPIIELILESVSTGTPLAEVCRQHWAPHASTWYAWVNDDPELDRRFARAREIGQTAIEAHSRLVARGEQGYSSGDVRRDRLIVDVNDRMLDRWDRRYTAGRGADDFAIRDLVDPRDGKYFQTPDHATEFVIAVIFARAEQRRAEQENRDPAGYFTDYMVRNGFPDLVACEEATLRIARTPSAAKATPQPESPPADDASDLA